MADSLALQAAPPVSTADEKSTSAGGVSTVAGLRFYGDEFVFDTVSGMFFRLSTTASFILRSLVGGVSLSDLPAIMEQQYGVDHATSTRDIQLFLNELAAIEPLDRFVHDKASTY